MSTTGESEKSSSSGDLEKSAKSARESVPPSSSSKPTSRPKDALDAKERDDDYADRADEERIAPATDPPTSDTVPPRIVPRPISSSPIVITPDSLSPPSGGSGENAPPSAIIENAMGRHRPQMPISTIVGISGGVLILVVGLALLLFR